MLDIPIDIQTPPGFCQTSANFAKSVMEKVNNAELNSIRASYAVYSGDLEMVILRKALDNYVQSEPITPSEFGISIYKQCEKRRGIKK